MPKVLKAADKQEVQYCIPLWLRDLQVEASIKRAGVGRIEPRATHGGRIAIVCFGPSLKQTWPQVLDFDALITVSGAHKFLLDQGITPEGRSWWHVEVDPRDHKIQLLGPPQPGITYLPASCCSPAYFDHLLAHGADVKLWHVFDSNADAQRVLPRGEWAITGGCNVGLRAMTVARFFGYTQMHVFGMDACEGDEVGKKHAAAHPLQDGTDHALVEYPDGSGRMWRTTASMLESARQTWHELDMMHDVTATFHGEGLVQEMSKHYVRKAKPVCDIAVAHPELISAEYKRLNAQLHESNLLYGVGGAKHADTVKKLCAQLKTQSVLDYGCGKGMLGKALDFPIYEYDPAIIGKDTLPRPADLVVCSDVLEHIEPDHLQAVVLHLASVTKKVAYLVIHTGPAAKVLADGRNAHLIQQGEPFWRAALAHSFDVAQCFVKGPELHIVAAPKRQKAVA